MRDLRQLVIELEEKRKRVQEVLGKPPDEMHAKSILAAQGVDPWTCSEVDTMSSIPGYETLLNGAMLQVEGSRVGTLPWEGNPLMASIFVKVSRVSSAAAALGLPDALFLPLPLPEPLPLPLPGPPTLAGVVFLAYAM